MTNFFSAIQGKFKAKFHGRYLGHILEQIAAVRPEVMKPILQVAPLGRRTIPRTFEQTVSAESNYLESSDRFADLEIELVGDGYSGRVAVEIKMFDSFSTGQLGDYVKWAKGRSNDDRAVVVLTAFPLDADSKKFIDENGNLIRHMYLSDLADGIDAIDDGSELLGLFRDYLSNEGYSMYKLSQKNDGSDVESLKSFMVLSFLPHASGQGRVATKLKISRGPEVFANLVQNWQLISARVGEALKLNNRIPTVRYVPQQAATEGVNGTVDLRGEQLLDVRLALRKQKAWGRYWIFSESLCPEREFGKLSVEWGQLLQIQRGGKGDADSPVECGIYALIRTGQDTLGQSRVNWLENGITNPCLYQPETLMKLIDDSVKEAAAVAIKANPQVAECLPWIKKSA